MKVRIYGAKQDEIAFYETIREQYPVEPVFAGEILTMDTVDQTRGFEAVWILTMCKITREVAFALKENGVKYVVTRSAGWDHMDLAAMKEAGLKGANVPFYSPRAISEHAILTALSILRCGKKQQHMIEAGNFTLAGVLGKELNTMTAGVVGTGRIGYETISFLKGFGCRVLAYDLYENEPTAKLAEYVPLNTLFSQADIVFFHCPLTEEYYHLLNREAIAGMKDGVYIVNNARGGLVEAEAVLEGLESGKIAGFGFDVYENENVFLRKSGVKRESLDPVFQRLLAREDTIYTAHTGFYTDKAIESMIEVTLENLKEYAQTGNCRNELVK